MMENPTTMKDKDIKDSIANLVGLIVKKYNQNLSMCIYILCMPLISLPVIPSNKSYKIIG